MDRPKASLLGVYNNSPPRSLDRLAEHYETVARETRSAAKSQRIRAAEAARSELKARAWRGALTSALDIVEAYARAHAP